MEMPGVLYPKGATGFGLFYDCPAAELKYLTMPFKAAFEQMNLCGRAPANLRAILRGANFVT